MSNDLLNHIPEGMRRDDKPAIKMRSIRMREEVDKMLSDLTEELNVTRTAVIHGMIVRTWHEYFEQ